MTRRRPTHITTKHCETKYALMFDCTSTTCSAKNTPTTSKSTKNASVFTTSNTAPESRKPCKLGTPTCLATIQTKGATTSRAEAERATNKRLDKCFKDMKPTNHLSTKPTSNLLIQNKFQSNSSNSNKQPWKKRANDHQPQEMGARRQNK